MAVQGIYTNFPPESYLPDFALIPSFYKPTQVTYTLSDFQLETDTQGRQSIIRLVDSNDNRITPYIDFSKYDPVTKDWIWYNEIEHLPYRMLNRNSKSVTMQNFYPTSGGTIVSLRVSGYLYSDVSGIWIIGGTGYNDPHGLYRVYFKYSPILLVGDNVPFTDLTDYSTMSTINNLDMTTTSPQFYYDFEERLYTNQNLAWYTPSNVKIKFYSVGFDSLSFKCVMKANSGSKPKSTPVVDDYIVKLKGQFLRN